MSENRVDSQDPFLSKYQPSDLRIASEFLTNWLPFLSRDLCPDCTRTLSDRVKSLDLGVNGNSKSETEEGGTHLLPDVNELHQHKNEDNNHETNSPGSDQDEAETNSLGSWKDGAQGCFETPQPASSSTSPPAVETPTTHMSWADMAQEDDELAAEDEQGPSNRSVNVNASTGELTISTSTEKPKLSRDRRECIRFKNVVRNKDFLCYERVDGKLVNILQGLELHAGVFSAAEQKRIVDFVYELQEKGRMGELKERTYSAPQRWMRGKGRVTLQFGCCYNYAMDRNGNPPGILQDEMVDPIPPLFKVIIKRLVRWHVLPPACVPDSCIVNIYEEGDCIPPHIDNHDFVRPFCTVSFLSECDIVFGSRLKIISPGEFDGPFAITLPVGSVLVLNGNGADVAKHCVPAVPTKRISITFRKMEDSKRPKHYVPEPDLQDIQPLAYEVDRPKGLPGPDRNVRRQPGRREPNLGSRSYPSRGNVPTSPHYSAQNQRGPANRRGVKVNIDQ